MIVMIKANDTIEMYSNVFTPNCINHPKLSPFFQGINNPQHGFMAARRSNAKVAPSTGEMSCGHTTGVCLWHSWCLSYLWFQLVIHGWFQLPSYMYVCIYIYVTCMICNELQLNHVFVSCSCHENDQRSPRIISLSSRHGGIGCRSPRAFDWHIIVAMINYCHYYDVDDRRKFRSQTSDNMDRWKAEMGRVSEEKRRRKKIKEEKVSEERRSRCPKR